MKQPKYGYVVQGNPTLERENPDVRLARCYYLNDAESLAAGWELNGFKTLVFELKLVKPS